MMMNLAYLPGGMPGLAEIGVVALILVLLFGARKLPELARALGSSLTEFKRGIREGSDKTTGRAPRTTANEPEPRAETPPGEA